MERGLNTGALHIQVSWGVDLASEHERYLTEEVFKQPVIVYNYPKEIKVSSPAAVLHHDPHRQFSTSCMCLRCVPNSLQTGKC